MEIFHTLAEVSVAITGFSSLIIIFRGSSSKWSRQDYISFAFILCWSIGCIFLSVQPIVLVQFGIDIADAARIGLFSTVSYMFIVGIILSYRDLKISRESGGRDKSRLNFWMSLLFSIIVINALAAAMKLTPGPMEAWYATTIVLLMAHSTAELGVFVVRSTRHEDTG